MVGVDNVWSFFVESKVRFVWVHVCGFCGCPTTQFMAWWEKTGAGLGTLIAVCVIWHELNYFQNYWPISGRSYIRAKCLFFPCHSYFHRMLKWNNWQAVQAHIVRTVKCRQAIPGPWAQVLPLTVLQRLAVQVRLPRRHAMQSTAPSSLWHGGSSTLPCAGQPR